jgi:hypothetical protein
MKPNQEDELREEMTGDCKPSALRALPLQAREHPALPAANKVMRGYNGNTMWVAMGLLGTVIFSALVLAVQERRPAPAEVMEKATEKNGGVLSGDSPAASSEIDGLSGNGTGGISSEHTTNAGDRLTPEINAGVDTSVTSSSVAQRRDPAHLSRPKMSRRSSIRSANLDVKTRLLALWHQSLERSKRSRSQALFLRSNKRERKKAGDRGVANYN